MGKAPFRFFRLRRHTDSSGLSGTGIVAVGVEFPSGKCCVEWLSPLRSVTIYDSRQVVADIHGHGGDTDLEWISEGDALTRESQ